MQICTLTQTYNHASISPLRWDTGVVWKGVVFPHYLVKQKTQKLSFYLNAVCCFVKKHRKHIKYITWSPLKHPSLSRLCVPDRTYRKEIGKVRHVFHTLHDYHVHNGVSRHVANTACDRKDAIFAFQHLPR